MNSPTSVADSHTGGSRHAFIGMIFLSASTFVLKVSSFAAQLVLGAILVKDDFELWAMACAANTIVAGLRDGGAGRILMQKGCAAHEIRRIAHFCWVLNIVAFFWLLAFAPIAAKFFGRPEVVPLIFLIGVSILIMTPTTIGKARMSSAMRFKELAYINGINSIFSYSLMVVLALSGFGAISFVIPQVATSAIGAIFFNRVVGPVPAGERLTWQGFKEIFSSAKWLILGAFALSFGMNGDYIVIGRFEKSVLADYFFGFQLTLSISTLFAQAFQQVLLPMFVSLNDDRVRQGKAFKRAIDLTLFAGAPLCCAMVVLSPPLMSILWNGKWDAAIIVVQVMSMNLMLRLMTPLSIALFQSHAQWKVSCGVLATESAVIIVASYIGTQIGGLLAVTLCVGILRAFSPPTIACIAAKSIGVSRRATLLSIARYILPFTAVAGLVIWLSHTIQTSDSLWIDLGTRASLLTVGYVALFGLVFRQELFDLLQLARNRSNRRVTTDTN